MIIETSRFGKLEVDEDRLMYFEDGILGFPDQHRYALIQTGEESVFYWLQAVDRPGLAFVVCDPRMFVADYQVPVKREDIKDIGINDPSAAQVFIIANKVDGMLTGNFQGPLVINVKSRQARQVVLSEKRYGTRHPLMRVDQAPVMEKTA